MQHAQKQRSEVRRQLVEETMRCRGTLDAWETLQEQIATMQPKQVQLSSREGKRPHASRSTWSNAERGKCGAWLKQRQGTPCRRVDCLSNPTKLRGRIVGLPARPVLDKMGRFRSGKLELDVNRPGRPFVSNQRRNIIANTTWCDPVEMPRSTRVLLNHIA
jgi:hypothetical protein